MVQPLGHNPQSQSITVALKNICRDYPAGGGVLRELLQNADDAGASTVRFVLDQASYSTATLVDQEVADHQGPSLLAYNNAIFSDQDFNSLSRIGDSCKLQDGSTTGRFGRGFNAVYNWTDSPSIVSRNRLLILDPHHRWTKHYPNPGGPFYDFVENAGDMRDQMAAFSAIMEEFDRPFQGTIIRIPLRTLAQAKTSQICCRQASFSEIAHVMQSFADDFGHTGLLFMKNVSKISIVVGDEPPFNIRICNHEEVRRHKTEINAAIKKSISEGRSNFSTSFKVEIKSGSPKMERQCRFAIHHSIQEYPDNERLNSWSKDEAMIPWVAIASELQASHAVLFFNVLPSQIHINQPIHIHSCFSMSPDRARLHKIGDSSVQYPLPGQWNHWLFDRLIPTAWTNLLIYLAQQYPNQSAFGMWPKLDEDTDSILYHIDKKVLRIVEQNNHRIWYTDLGYVTLDSGLIAGTKDSSVLRRALDKAGVPVIYLTDDLLSSVEMSCKVESLRPQTLCSRLEQGREQLRMTSVDEKQTLLDYVISDPNFRGYGAVELFPFEDGIYRAIDHQAAFIHRDEDEHVLFQLEQDRNIELEKLSKSTLQILQKGCSLSSLHQSLRYRSTSDLKTYCLQTRFKTFDLTKDLISTDENTSNFILSVWDWIVTGQYSILDSNISCLWLIPLTDGKHRKIKPINASFETIYAPPGKLGDFLKSLTGIASVSNKPIIQADDLSSRSLQLLTGAMERDPSLFIKNGDSLEDFMLWLSAIRRVFDVATDDTRWDLHKLLVSRLETCKDRKTISDVLHDLKVFQRVVWRAKNERMVSQKTWISLNGQSGLVGLCETDPVPNVGEVTFLKADSDNTKRLLNYFELAKCPSQLELMKDFMIPFWENKVLLEDWTTSGKEQIAESLLRHFSNLDGDSQKQISSLAIVPVKRFDWERIDKFSMAKQLIDPSNVDLRDLFFNDEEPCPVDWAFDRYRGSLIECGLKIALDQDLVEDRVRCFAKRSQEEEETSKRARKVLKSVTSWRAASNDNETSPVRELQWLPAINLHGLRVFKNARECRSLDDKLLVGFVLPVLDFEISEQWRNRLGWNHPIPHATMLEQLQHGIKQEDRSIIDAVLKHIRDKTEIDHLRPELLVLSCVVVSNGQFVLAQKTFRSGCDRLQPYLYNVDRRFWAEHSTLLEKLGVREKPGLDDLLRIQESLPSKTQLDERDIPVAIEISRLASTFPRNLLSSLKIPDETGRLRALDDVTFNDLGLSTITGTFNSAHPDIPKNIIKTLQIEPLSARVKKGELGIADADDEEFDQHEDVATGISDTLTRYTIESTFREFLANADDCKAEQLNWLLDKRNHPKKYLLTEELRAFQGAALLVHNDGVFDEKDFEGLRCVGRGSKRDDPSTIGKFGRGSQTMFHWTDVPMLLSGRYLVILDPLRQVLDMNYRTHRRRPGVKIELSKLKDAYRDQLAPFDGLWGFSRDLDYYQGTIFRFPLRSRTAQSKLLETGTPLDADAVRTCLDNFLEQEGRISLLFLRKIRYIDFKIYGDAQPRWSVHSRVGEPNRQFSGWTYCTITKCMNTKLDGAYEDQWWVAIQDVTNLPTGLHYSDKERMKNVECGMAALVPNPNLKQVSIFANLPVPRFYSALPLPFPTELPIHIHTTFHLASDRASIPIGDSCNAMAQIGIKDLGRKTIGLHKPFQFWPQESPSRSQLSELICSYFWQELRESSCLLFPVTRQIKAIQAGNREAPKLVNIEGAIFDFLQESKSTMIRDVLESQITNLVRVPDKIRCELGFRKKEVESVTPRRLCQLFKQENASERLEKAALQDPKVLETCLDIIKPLLDEDFTELEGCRILPLADGSLGTLRLVDTLKPVLYYYMSNAEELQLFDFASENLAGPEPGKLFKKALMDCKKFNVTRLKLSDVGGLLERQTFGNRTLTKDLDAWLAKFWDYWRRTEIKWPEMKTTSMTSQGISHHPIFEATCNGIKTYIEPEKLDILPSVIEPDKPEQLSLCNKFPGIHIFSFGYLPTYLRTSESSLDYPPSFARFITAVSKLAKKDGIDLELYIKNHLATTEIEMLQKLIVNYVSKDMVKAPEMQDLLRSLPVWPTEESSSWITAAVALAKSDSSLLVPWMIGYQRFVNHQALIANWPTLKALGVSKTAGIEHIKMRILPTLPREIPDVDTDYRSFIRAISRISDWRSILDVLRLSRLAPNRARKLHLACELYDNEDVIFQSALRNEADAVFLLAELEESKRFWLELGLKNRLNGQFAPADYISCLIKMRHRLENCTDSTLDPNLIADAQVVLTPLTTPSTALGLLTKRDWSIVAEEATFPAMTTINNESLYRRETMAILSAAMPLLQLSEIIGSKYISICWSQTSFPASQPTEKTLGELPSKGMPPMAMVWRHLEHMATTVGELSENAVASFLSDLYEAYDYLQDNLANSTESFVSFRSSKVWFNLEHTDSGLVSTENLDSSQCRIESLILESSCDTKNLKSVKQGLIRYQRLLRALGCKSIVYPPIETPDMHPNQLVSTSLSRLRREGKLLDITLEAEGGNIQAHKVVIAAASAYFATQFNGRWSNNDSIDLKQFSHSTLSTVVDFAYADTFDWASMQVSDNDAKETIENKLDDLLDLLVAADYFDMPNLKAHVENQIMIPAKLFIKEPNVLRVLELAAEANAHRVEAYCTRFYSENREAVDLASRVVKLEESSERTI